VPSFEQPTPPPPSSGLALQHVALGTFAHTLTIPDFSTDIVLRIR
jgi:hypothetical protein